MSMQQAARVKEKSPMDYLGLRDSSRYGPSYRLAAVYVPYPIIGPPSHLVQPKGDGSMGCILSIWIVVQ